MEKEKILLIHLSENGKLPFVNDVYDYEESWNPNLILYGNCIEFKESILKRGYIKLLTSTFTLKMLMKLLIMRQPL